MDITHDAPAHVFEVHDAVRYLVLRKGEKEVSRFAEEQDKLTGASQQMTLEKLYPLKDLEPGRYNLVVNVTDNLSKRTISPIAKFEVR